MTSVWRQNTYWSHVLSVSVWAGPWAAQICLRTSAARPQAHFRMVTTLLLTGTSARGSKETHKSGYSTPILFSRRKTHLGRTIKSSITTGLKYSDLLIKYKIPSHWMFPLANLHSGESLQCVPASNISKRFPTKPKIRWKIEIESNSCNHWIF